MVLVLVLIGLGVVLPFNPYVLHSRIIPQYKKTRQKWVYNSALIPQSIKKRNIVRG